MNRKEYMKEYSKKWRQENKEEIKNNNAAYYVKNKEKIDASNKKWALENPCKVLEMHKNWQKTNPEKRSNSILKYYLGHKEQESIRGKKYRLEHPEVRKEWKLNNPDKIGIYRDKIRIKRRLWGPPVYMNKKFAGAVRHHLEKQLIMWIPEWLHKKKGFWHDLEKGIGMVKMNTWAMAWFEGLI
jgi:hypothetical protein